VAFDPVARFPVGEEDVEYSRADGAPLLARVYRPRDLAGPLPALIDVHGGAWTFFDRTADAYFDRALAACGLVVVALDFRQAPAHRHPAAVDDVLTGIRFVRTGAARFGVDPARIGLVGGSSGGHLLLLAALRAEADVAFALPLWPIADPGARYRYLVDRIAHPRPSADPFFKAEILKQAHEAYFPDLAAMDAASVPHVIASGRAERLPPVWIAHPEQDENVTLEMTHHLVDTYRRAGGAAELRVFEGVGHAFAHSPGEAADRCIAGMREFIGRQLERIAAHG
jgi:acetyl esterase/lipase